jgi:hypothetical protein
MEKSNNLPQFTLENEISKYVYLEKHVIDNDVFFVGACPFHPKQTIDNLQSLYVDPQKQNFRCFKRGCIANNSYSNKRWGVEEFLKLVEEYSLQPVLQNLQTFQPIVQGQEAPEEKEPFSDKDTDTEKIDVENQLPLFDGDGILLHRVSYSMLENYQLCPLKYKHIYIDKENLEMVSDRRRIGTSVHNTLKEFYSLPVQERTYEGLSHIFQKNWSVLQSDNLRFFNEYYSMMKSLIETESYHSFTVKLETAFSFSRENLNLFGRIDRIDRLEGGGYEVVDYKTLKSEPSTENEAKDSLQSIFLYFGTYDIIGELPTRITYLHIEDGRRVSFLPSYNEMEKNFKKIRVMVEKIRGKRHFVATKNAYCSACKLLGKCPATR